MKKLGILILFLGFTFQTYTQEVHLSQYYTTQQFYNVATMGDYDGLYRFSANYRSQWRQIGQAPVITSVLAFDHRFYIYSDELNLGLILLNDQFATFGLNTSKIQLSAAYKKVMYGHEFRIGIQGGLVLKQTDLGNQTFPNQWVYNEGEFKTEIDNLEEGLKQSTNYTNINTGIAWAKTYGKYTPKAGFSLLHINTPTNSFFNDKNERLKVAPVFHASLDYTVNSSLILIPKIYYLNSHTSQNTLIGSSIIKKTNHTSFHQLSGGLLYRSSFGSNRDAIIAIIGLSYKNFDFGMSYDLNIGQLSQSYNRKASTEFSLVYTSPAFKPKQVTLPCDRY